jgi:hypothetical protein
MPHMRVPAFNRSDDTDRAKSRARIDPIAAQSAAACGCQDMTRFIFFTLWHQLDRVVLNFIDLFKSGPSHVFAPYFGFKPLVSLNVY